MKTLRISPKLELPPDAVTQTFVVYGMKGQGKTVFGAVLAEELAATGHKFSYLDPIGPGYGLRYGADGKGEGLKVLVLGGRHGDLPIEPTGGAVVADLVVNEPVNTVIDISRRADGKMWSHGEKIRFTADYCTRLYERQGEKCYPLMQIIDEAGRFCPQTIPSQAPDIARCVGAIEQLTELGRNVGVGICLITQRSARMAKAVSELAECMIAFRTVGPNSVGAIVDWLGEHIPRERHKEVVEQLRKLPRGSALVVSPGWLDFEGIVPLRMRRTFDSSVTPTADRQLIKPRTLATHELERYGALIAETVTKSQENDPAALRREIAKLKAELAKKPAAAPRVETKPVEVPALTNEERVELARLVASVELLWTKTRELTAETAKHLPQVQRSTEELQRAINSRLRPQPEARRPRTEPQKSITNTTRHTTPAANGEPMSKGEAKLMNAIAQYPDGVEKQTLKVLTGYRSTSINEYTRQLIARGYVAAHAGTYKPTEAGTAALGDAFEPLPQGWELVAHWKARLTGGERKIFDYIVESHPEPLPKERVMELTSYKSTSVNEYARQLIARQIVTRADGGYALSEAITG